jgi:hypothetical protein
MASILVIEDGSGVPDANSYATAAEARAYASLRGSALPAIPQDGNDPVETALILAAEYIDSLSFVGIQATTTQGLAWPRVFTEPMRGFPFYRSAFCVALLEQAISSDYYAMPLKVKEAQQQLVIENIINGIDFMPSVKGGTQFAIREKVDVIETSYSEKIGTLSAPTMRRVNAKLADFLVRGGGAKNSIPAVRM